MPPFTPPDRQAVWLNTLGSSAQRTGEEHRNRPHPESADPDRVLYLCTTFPRLSETFVEREVRHLAGHLPLQVVSIWKGDHSEGLPVRQIPLSALFTLPLRIPLWLLRNPSGLLRLLQVFFRKFPRTRLNLEETLLGMGMGVILADEVRKHPPVWTHAIWATAPATMAWTLYQLTGNPFSFGAHAYDLFQDGGDCLLKEKIADSTWIRTSTQASADELVRRNAPLEKIVLVRRGLMNLPAIQIPKPPGGKLRLLSIGRLVPKKGYADLIRLFIELRNRGVDFEATIIGDGPLRQTLARRISEQGLDKRVWLTGALPPAEVEPHFAKADLFLFTGRVSPDGDRDGLPNVVPEAMAHGVPVLVRAAPGVLEAITHEKTGEVFQSESPEQWAVQVIALWENHEKRCQLSKRARRWVEENFLSSSNTDILGEKILSSAAARTKNLQV